MENSVHKVFAVLYPSYAGPSLTEWDKGCLLLASQNHGRVSEEAILEALIALLLTTSPTTPESYTQEQPKISKLIDTVLGTHVHENTLEDVRGLLEEGKKMEEIRKHIFS